jgi:hypothetical protein
LIDGNAIVRYLNIEIPDFPSIILTSFADDSRNEKTVINPLILERDIMTKDVDGEDFLKFIKIIENMIMVFQKRLSLNVEEYQALISRRKNNDDLTPYEEQRLMSLYRVLLLMILLMKLILFF